MRAVSIALSLRQSRPDNGESVRRRICRNRGGLPDGATRWRPRYLKGEPMDLDADLQEKIDVARPPSSAATCFRFFRRFTIVALVATAITALTTCLTVWISTLTPNTPVTLSHGFRSWSRIIEFNAFIWLGVFVLCAPFAIIYLGRWWMLKGEIPRTKTRQAGRAESQ